MLFEGTPPSYWWEHISRRSRGSRLRSDSTPHVCRRPEASVGKGLAARRPAAELEPRISTVGLPIPSGQPPDRPDHVRRVRPAVHRDGGDRQASPVSPLVVLVAAAVWS